MADNANLSSYLQHLPAIYSEEPFLGRFLLAFEQILTGQAASTEKRFLDQMGVEEIIERISAFFDPLRLSSLFRDETEPDKDKLAADKKRSDEFLAWLAGWVALSLRADWTLEQQKKFLADVVPLYRKRGTQKNLIHLLSIYTFGEPSIDEGDFASMQIGVHSTIGEDTRIGEPPAHFFRVTVNLGSKADGLERERQEQIARAVIELQKPAHTSYQLRVVSDTMKIGVRSTISKDTLVGIKAVDNGKEVF